MTEQTPKEDAVNLDQAFVNWIIPRLEAFRPHAFNEAVGNSVDLMLEGFKAWRDCDYNFTPEVQYAAERAMTEFAATWKGLWY